MEKMQHEEHEGEENSTPDPLSTPLPYIPSVSRGVSVTFDTARP